MKRVLLFVLTILLAGCGVASPAYTPIPTRTPAVGDVSEGILDFLPAQEPMPTYTPYPSIFATNVPSPASPPLLPKATSTSPVNTPPATVMWGCSADIYNCLDFTTQARAQAVYNFCKQLGQGDVHRLDRDKDGVVCESLP